MKDFIALIKENSISHPDRIAVIDREKKINYNDFWGLVNSYCCQIKPRSKIIIDLEQGIEAYALIVAILTVGGTYCPLSPAAPLERKRQIIDEFSPDLVIVSSGERALEFNNATVTTLESLKENIGGKDLDISWDGEDIAYVIYTSGSTGVPKGVKICRKALNKFLEWSVPTYGASESDVWAQFSFLSFDLSIVDIFTCLCSGATLYSMNDIPAKTYRPDRIIENVKITIWHSVPSVVEFMIKNSKSRSYDFSSLKLMSFCGEPLKKHQVEFLFEKNKSLKIFNTYGPTEGTLFCTWQELDTENYLNYFHHSMSIGKAIPGWNLKLIPLEEFEEKEVLIYGDYIGSGYLGSIADTKFKKINIDGKLVGSFETGDLVNQINGSIYFSCRKDRQIKLKGYRIELDEIDFRINEFLKMTSVTVVKNETLYSFIETSNGIDNIELRNHLKKVLEEYKIPHGFYAIPEIPRNQNQKVDIDMLKGKING